MKMIKLVNKGENSLGVQIKLFSLTGIFIERSLF